MMHVEPHIPRGGMGVCSPGKFTCTCSEVVSGVPKMLQIKLLSIEKNINLGGEGIPPSSPPPYGTLANAVRSEH